jgi:hypothetical protein
MTRKFLTALALTAAVATGATTLGAQPAEAKCKFGCGLAIGLGAGILGSAIVESNRGSYYDDGYRRSSYGYRRGGWVGSQAWLDYCYSRYKSFDPYSGTYMGYDGYRHACR